MMPQGAILAAGSCFGGTLGTSFNEKFDQHGAWRREFALRLKLLAQWLKDQELMDASVEDRLQRLEAQVRVDKVMVAFVAEFSRGKSELINAIFLPTMVDESCPPVPDEPPCVRPKWVMTRRCPVPTTVAHRNEVATAVADGVAHGAREVGAHRLGGHQSQTTRRGVCQGGRNPARHTG